MSANQSPFFAGPNYATELSQRDTGAISTGAMSAVAPSLCQSPLARATDPLTSHEAAARVAEFASAHHQRVMDALRRAGGRAGAEQIGWLASMEPHAVRRRLPELQAMGVIRPTEERAMTRSGRRERIWVVVG